MLQGYLWAAEFYFITIKTMMHMSLVDILEGIAIIAGKITGKPSSTETDISADVKKKEKMLFFLSKSV